MTHATNQTMPAAYHRPPAKARRGCRLVSLQVQASQPAPKRTGYDCPELRPTPGIPDSRFAAYRLPSRMGNRLHWPDGRITDLDANPIDQGVQS